MILLTYANLLGPTLAVTLLGILDGADVESLERDPAVSVVDMIHLGASRDPDSVICGSVFLSAERAP